MNWHKLFANDLKRGLLRRRYWLVPIFFILPCFLCGKELDGLGFSGTVGDYLLYFFKGSPVRNLGAEDFSIPVLWMLPFAGCLLLNMDYVLTDLSLFGQHIVTRSGSRKRWYLSKCVWNAAACVMCFGTGILVITGFALLSGAQATLHNTPIVTRVFFLETLYEELALSGGKVVIMTIAAPIVTITALSMVEMTLSLFVKPVLSFLACLCIITLSIFVPKVWMLGNGAMAVRSVFVTRAGVSPLDSIGWACMIILACIFAGIGRFRRTDILPGVE